MSAKKLREYFVLDEQAKKRLFWHCRRGMLELDLLLQRFLEKKIDSLAPEEIEAFDTLLGCTDPELYAWLMGQAQPEDNRLKHIVATIRATY